MKFLESQHLWRRKQNSISPMPILLLFSLCLSKPSYAQEANGYVAGEVLVGIRADKDDAGLAQRLAFVGADVEQIANLHIHRLRLLPGFTVMTAIAALRLLPDVTYAEPNAYLYGSSTPNNPAYMNQQYGPQRVQANLAWNIWQPRQTVYIAVLDTGVDDTHPCLTNKMYRDSSNNVIGYNVGVTNYHTNDTVSTMDDNGHGTVNAGIAAAQINNGIGVAGIAGWNGIAGQTDTNSVKIIPVKVLYNDSAANLDNPAHAYGFATTMNVAKGINWVSNLNVNGKKIINMSLTTAPFVSGTVRNPPAANSLGAAINSAYSSGCLLVAIAGNDGQTQSPDASTPDASGNLSYYTYPAFVAHVLSVAASDSNDTSTYFSHYGDWINVAAPGSNIYSTMPTYAASLNNPGPGRPALNFNYDYLSGTSQSCPHVAGEAALIWAQNPSLTNDQVTSIILNNTDSVTPYSGHASIGGGRINVYRGLRAAGFGRERLDIDWDGHADLIFQSRATGQLGYWLLNGAAEIGYGSFTYDPNLAPGADYKVVGTCDLNADGHSDLVFQSQSTGQLGYWLLNHAAEVGYGNFTYTAGLAPGTDYKVVGTPDLNGDGKPDLLFQSQSTGQLGCWLMNGTTETSAVSLTYPAGLAPGPNIKVVATADLNGDGQADLIFQNQTTGQLSYWLLNGTSEVGYGYFSFDPNLAPGTDYKLIGVADLNSDGSADLIFQSQSTGQLGYWLMNGTTEIGYGSFTYDPNLAPGTDYKAISTR